jgi:hypothetical protein
MVVAPDGQAYGPASVESLSQWAKENRIGPDTTLKDFATGRTMPASAVPGIFPDAPVSSAGVPPQLATAPGAPQTQTDWSKPPAPYVRPAMGQPSLKQDNGTSDIWGALIRSVLALVLFFFLHTIGLVFAIYGVMAAVRALQKGHKFGVAAVVISAAALVAIGIGYFLMFSGGGGGYRQ